MDLICCRKKKVKSQNSQIDSPCERYKDFLDSIIENKSFNVTKTIDYGNFGASIIIKQDETDNKIKVRILKEEYLGEKERDWEKLEHRNLQKLLKLEYLESSKSFLFYTTAEETTLQDKIGDRCFRSDTESLWKLLYWLEGIADATHYLQANGYSHMDLEARSMIITADEKVKISHFHHLSSIHSRTDQ